jgi:hypothetical protein
LAANVVFVVDARDNARSRLFTRCKACATPLDLNNSLSLNENIEMRNRTYFLTLQVYLVFV